MMRSVILWKMFLVVFIKISFFSDNSCRDARVVNGYDSNSHESGFTISYGFGRVGSNVRECHLYRWGGKKLINLIACSRRFIFLVYLM